MNDINIGLYAPMFDELSNQEDNLKQEGIYFHEKTTEGMDALLIDVRNAVKGPYLLNKNIPVFIADMKKENCSISKPIAKLCGFESVKKVLRHHVYRPRDLHVTGTPYHYHLIYRQDPDFLGKILQNSIKKRVKTNQNIKSDHFDKMIGAWASMLFLGRWRSSVSHMRKFDLNEDRPFDLNFLGSLGHSNALVPYHRQQCYHAIKNMGKKVKSITRSYWLPTQDYMKYFDVPEQGKIKTKEHSNLLTRSKICVSPWGNGESCIRDFEAWYAGCVVIKPDTSWLQTWPDMYQDKYYVPCKYDFSDLEEKTNHILSNWDSFMEMRINARNEINYALNNFAKNFRQIIESGLQ